MRASARETQTKETKRKRGNAVETEKGNGENREQEEGWEEGGGMVVATRDYLRKQETKNETLSMSVLHRQKKRENKSQSLCPEL